MKLDTTDYSKVFTGHLKVYVKDTLQKTPRKLLRKAGTGEKVLREVFWRYEKTFDEFLYGSDGKRFYEGTFLVRRNAPWSAVRKICRDLLKKIKNDSLPNAFDFMKRPDYSDWYQFSCLPYTNFGAPIVTSQTNIIHFPQYQRKSPASAEKRQSASTGSLESSFEVKGGLVVPRTTTATRVSRNPTPLPARPSSGTTGV